MMFRAFTHLFSSVLQFSKLTPSSSVSIFSSWLKHLFFPALWMSSPPFEAAVSAASRTTGALPSSSAPPVGSQEERSQPTKPRYQDKHSVFFPRAFLSTPSLRAMSLLLASMPLARPAQLWSRLLRPGAATRMLMGPKFPLPVHLDPDSVFNLNLIRRTHNFFFCQRTL